MPEPETNWIIGTGSGRCGSTSLATLLGNQPGITITHETFGPFDYRDESYARRLNGKMCGAGSNGDVASQWLWHAEYWLDRDLPGFRMVCLRRPKEATMESFMRWTDPHGYDHWSKGDRTENVWDKAFPTYQTPYKRQALETYYEHYYGRARELAWKYPARFRVFESPRCLTDPDYQRKMLHFAGIRDPSIDTGIHKNAS